MSIYKPGDIVQYRKAREEYSHVFLTQVFDKTALGQQIDPDGYTLHGEVLVIIANIQNLYPLD